MVVFGDSLTYHAEAGRDGGLESDETFLTDELVRRGLTASVAATIGATTTDLVTVADDVPDPGADIVLIALGTNDLHEGTDGWIGAEQALANIDAALSTVDADCVALVGVLDTDEWGISAEADPYNEGLESRADIYGDWDAVVAEHPDYVGSDGIHHTPEGSSVYRTLLADVAQGCDELVAANEL